MSFFDESNGAAGHPSEYRGEGLSKPRRNWRAVLGFSLTGLFLVGVAYAFNAPTPYVIEQPGTVFNVLGSDSGSKIITVNGAKTYEDKGKLFLLTVGLVGNPDQTPNWVEVLQAWNDPKKKVLPIDLVFPPGTATTDTTDADLAMMQDSQQQATAAALRALNYEVGDRVNVYSVQKDTPASGLLRAKDVITAVNGKPLKNGDTLRSLVKNNAGTEALGLTVLRGTRTVEVSVTPKKIKDVWRLGITITDSYDFPISVKLKLQDVGGPSGGMMFALGIIDKLTPGSLTGGLSVAGTGEIDGNGNVYPIGGIQQKMFGAVDAGATWFLAPVDNCDEVVGHIPEGLHVTKVATLSDSLAALKAISADPETKSLPQCTATK
ncbi:MAG: hypothetical protein RL196_819 [Actinomycetota bacterium]